MNMKWRADFTQGWKVAAATTCVAALGGGGCGELPDVDGPRDVGQPEYEESTETEEGESDDAEIRLSAEGDSGDDRITDEWERIGEAGEPVELALDLDDQDEEMVDDDVDALADEAINDQLAATMAEEAGFEACEWLPTGADKFCKYATLMWEWGSKINQIFEPTLSQEDLFRMRNDIGILKADVMQLKADGIRADARINAAILDALNRDVDLAYANVESAIQTVNAYPGDKFMAQVAEGQARTACNALDDDDEEHRFYRLQILPGLYRFEPRIATPTFVIAVTTWLGILEGAGIQMNAEFDGILSGYADQLEWIVSNVRSSVSCSSIQEQVDYPCGSWGSGCERHECHNYVECYDSVANRWDYYDYRRRDGTCPYISTPAPGTENQLEQTRYSADTHDGLVAQWRAQANLPNRNLALGQPAFDTPSTWVPPGRAVDGNTDGNWWSESVTHTDSTSQPWWWVDLGSVQHIDEIRLFNRTDCCSSRLSHYQIVVSADSTDGWDGSWHVIVDRSWQEIADGDGTPQVHPVDVWARWVAVTKTDLDYLSLAEVQVMGN